MREEKAETGIGEESEKGSEKGSEIVSEKG